MHGTHFPAAARRAAGAHDLTEFSTEINPTPPASADPDSDAAPASGLRVLRLADREATLTRATGSADTRVHDWLVNDVAFALTAPPALGDGARQDRVCAAVTALCDIAPRDAIEGMLATQMVAVHSAALDCLRRAADPVSGDRARDVDLRHAARLLNVFHRQTRIRDDRRNPVLAHSVTGTQAPDAPGRTSGLAATLAEDAHR